MPSLFSRKPDDATTTPEPEEVVDDVELKARPKGYTPSKKELGQVTPKRVSTARRPTDAAPATRREAYKQMRDRQRETRQEQTAGIRAGDPKFLPQRDQGPERALVRDLVDSRRTVGSWFIGGAVVVLVGSTVQNHAIQLGANILWLVLAFSVIVDSYLIARRVKKTVKDRFPKTTQKLSSLQFYGVMRGLTFRRMRIPKPQVDLGAKV